MRAAVLGSPISHSLSPVLHRAAYTDLGLDNTYDSFDIGAEEFNDFIDGLDDEWMGLSLTMPLKEVAFSVANVVTDIASMTQSINTLIFGSEVLADNTDVYGIVAAIREIHNSSIEHMTILGSGATARSALMAAHDMTVSSVNLVARNPESISVCAGLADELGITFRHSVSPPPEWMESHVVINTTPQGVADQWIDSIASPQGLLLDVVYKPYPTNLDKAWNQQGGSACPGYNMLLHQAVRQVELMTGQRGPLEAMRAALLDALNERGVIA